MDGHTPARGTVADAPRSFRAPHLSDYLGTVRDHAVAASLVAAAVLGLLVWNALTTTPKFTASSVIQIDLYPSSEGELIQSRPMYMQYTSVEAELAVIASREVARLAAIDEPAATAAIQEVNAFRPLEGLLRRLGRGTGRCVLEAECVPPAEGGFVWTIRFGDEGKGLDVRRRGHDEVVRVPDWRPGRAIEAWNTVVGIEIVSGAPYGKTFRLDVRSVEQAARAIQGAVAAEETAPFTGIVQVTYVADTPELAARLANAIARAYEQYRINRRTEDVKNRRDWLDTEVEAVRGELEELEQKRDAYAAENGGMLVSERALGTQDALVELDRQAFEQQQRVTELAGRIEDLDADQPAHLKLLLLGLEAADAKASALATKLVELETERDVLIREGSPELHPRLVELRPQIAEVGLRYVERVDALVTRQRAVLDRQLRVEKARFDEINANIDKQTALLERLPEVERELVKLNRPLIIQEQLFKNLLQLQMETDLLDVSIHSNVHAIDPADQYGVKASSRLAPKVLLAFVLALFAGVAVALLLEYLDRRVKSPDVLQASLGLPVLAAIPATSTLRRRHRRSLSSALVTRDAPHSLMAETYRTLRAQLRHGHEGKPLKTLAITSSVEQEGKTVTTLNLAIAMAQAGDRVCVVDADLRRPTTHVHLGAPIAPGLADALQGKASWQDCVRRTDVENLSVLYAGTATSNPGALLDSPAFVKLHDALKESYDYVLFDVPPALAVADAAAFLRRLDGVLLLVRYRRSTLEVVEGARDQVLRLGANLLGIVFNGFDARRSRTRNYGYYGYYGGGRYTYASSRRAPDA